MRSCYSNGTLDTTFSGDGKVSTVINGTNYGVGLAIQSNGMIVVAGTAGPSFGQTHFSVARYTSNGVLDAGFGGGLGFVTSSIATVNWAGGVAIQTNGRIVVGGTATDDNVSFTFALVRYGGIVEDTDGDNLLDSWELANWGTISGHNTLDDLDHDGYGDLPEEAFGLNPTQPDAAGLPLVIAEGGYLTMTITKHAGVTYSVESAGTLLTGQLNSFSPWTTTVLINDPTTLKVRDNVPIGTAPTRFMRVKVTAAP